MMKKFLSIFLILLLCTVLCGCDTFDNFRKAFIDPPSEDEMVIKIGVFEPASGRQSYDAEDEMAGIAIGYSMFPEIDGYRIELVYEDNHSNKDYCADAAQRLADLGCCVVLGSYSDSLSAAGSDSFKSNGLPAIAATCTIPVLTESNPYYYRVCTINSFDAGGAASYVFNYLGEDRCALLVQEDSDYAETKADLFEEKFYALCGSESFEYKYITVNEETQIEVEQSSREPRVKVIYASGNETDEEIEAILKELDAKGYASIYCPSDESFAFAWLRVSDSYIFIAEQAEIDEQKRLQEEKEAQEKAEAEEKAKEAAENGTGGEAADAGDSKITGQGDTPGGNDTEKQDSEEKEQSEEDKYFFKWIGSNLWSDIELNASTYLDGYLPGPAAEADEDTESTEDTEGTEEAQADEETAEERQLRLEAYVQHVIAHVCYTSDYDASASDNEMSDAFIEAYALQYPDDPVPSEYAALGFDAYYLAYSAIKNCIAEQKQMLEDSINPDELHDEDENDEAGSVPDADTDGSDAGENSDTAEDSTAGENSKDKNVIDIDDILFDENGVFRRNLLNESIGKIRNLQCVTGTISINSSGDPVKDTVIEGFVDNKFQVVYTVVPDSLD